MIEWFSATWWMGIVCGAGSLVFMVLIFSFIGAWLNQKGKAKLPTPRRPDGKG